MLFGLWISSIQISAESTILNSIHPSIYINGLIIDDPRCSLLFGKGFGPKPYQQLFDQWTRFPELYL